MPGYKPADIYNIIKSIDFVEFVEYVVVCLLAISVAYSLGSVVAENLGKRLFALL